MDITHIPAEPGAVAAVMAIMSGLGERSMELPADGVAREVPEGFLVTAGSVPAGAGVLVYVHGGGFEHRKPDLMNRVAYEFSRVTGRAVLVVHYRLAPAYPYPAPLDDVVAALKGLGTDKVIVLGESSGGALALSALLRLKEEGAALPASVLTLSAVTDLAITGASVDDSPGDPVDRAMLTYLIGQYLGTAKAAEAPQSPLHGALDGLPPLVMLVGGAEALRDDTLRFARAASAAGTKVEVDVYADLPHAFPIAMLEGGNPTGREVLGRIAAWSDQYR
jgi:monoterpene epsilon-lactone hydrolase